MPKKIKFKGEIYWLSESAFTDGNISPLNHYDENGNLAVSFDDISYAIIEGNKIMRFGECIGDVSEIEEVC
jgi:hypothetical protein